MAAKVARLGGVFAEGRATLLWGFDKLVLAFGYLLLFYGDEGVCVYSLPWDLFVGLMSVHVSLWREGCLLSLILMELSISLPAFDMKGDVAHPSQLATAWRNQLYVPVDDNGKNYKAEIFPGAVQGQCCIWRLNMS